MTELKRLNLRMGQDLFDYYKEISDSMGVPVSNLMLMVLYQNRQQAEGMKAMGDMMRVVQSNPDVAKAIPFLMQGANE